MFKFLKNLFGDDNEKEIKRMMKYVEQVNTFEPAMHKLSDISLSAKTVEFRRRLEKGETLDDLLPEAFAVVREASRRVLGMRHFDVQLLGGVTLHEGNIAEMRTGEGKTLVGTLATYLNALTGNGVHVVTVNDYLAKRDSEWMGKVYRFLGLSVGLIVHGLDFVDRRQAYHADITYGTNNEFGFDYLRDNMVIYADQMVQRPLNYAIVDEVDSILIDEARTPLIISGPGEKSTELYHVLARITPKLKEGEDYTVDEKTRTVAPTESGIAKAEKLLGITNLYDHANIEMSHHFNQALKATGLMKRDRDYVVKDGEVVIVDEFTGRLMFGRRYSDGLHQSIEAKEGVKVERESQTLASITFQNYFRMYKKLSGMTGTAKTEEAEFRKIYKLDVITIPTNKEVSRTDLPDVIYKTTRAKYKAVVDSIVERHAKGQPVLVGTTSIVQSEHLSDMLKKKNVPHNVLNAKYHEMEAQIVAQAGQLGAVTIATNMAGRGTDIVLGEGVPELGGLHIIGTERHESRRIDNQLRGRAGRQGDPGSSHFYLSLEDDLMRLFGSDNIATIMDKLGMEEDEPIEHSLITRSIEQAQKKVEGRNFDMRKHVLEYDDVMNQQREVIYGQRRQILTGENMKENIFHMIEKLINRGMELFADEKLYPEEWNLQGLIEYCEEIFAPEGQMKAEELGNLSRVELQEELLRVATDSYNAREALFGDDNMREMEKVVMLKVVDSKWMEHLDAMDMLREGISLRSYGQRDPLIEYKIEAYDMFQQLIDLIQEDIVKYIFRVSIVAPPEDRLQKAHATHGEEEEDNEQKPQQPVVNKDHIGRNDLCPCGSGQKYKKCCGVAK
ncbi:MAG: Protein translocase subunit secA [Pelosinus sp.]|nr:Protein translocase subunit secA [Pelosinus sp.]